MASLWYTDFCPTGRCILDNDRKRVVSLCPHHGRVMNDNALTARQIFDVIENSCRRLNYARYAAKVELGLDKEMPGLPYTVDAAGNFTIETSSSGARLTATRSAVTNRLRDEPKLTGSGSVSIA